MAQLVPTVAQFRQQTSTAVEARSSPGFHHRYLIADSAACYHSGASFKDGAKNAPTTLTQIVDALPAVHAAYEALWANEKLHQ